MNTLKLLLIVITVILLGYISSQAQEKEGFFVLLARTKERTYEVSPGQVNELGRTRSVILDGEFQGYRIITDWQIDCKASTGRPIEVRFYSPDDRLIKTKKDYLVPMTAPKGSPLREAMDKYWCNDV